ASPIPTEVTAFYRHSANHNLNARDRLPAAGVNHSPVNVAGLFRIRDRDVNIGGLRTFADFSYLRLGFDGRIRVKDSRIELGPHSICGRTGALRLPNADQIATFRQPIDAIETAIISLVHVEVLAVIEDAPRPVGRVEFAEIDPLLNHRPALRIGDPSGDHAAALDLEVVVFDLLAVGEMERLATHAEEITIFGRDISRRERGDRIPSGGDAGEMEPPALISPGARRIGRALILRLQDNHNASRRLTFQSDATGDRSRPCFRFDGLGLSRMKSARQN